MNETKTASMLQRIPVVLAVTAASYGLQLPQQVQRWSAAYEARALTAPAESADSVGVEVPAAQVTA